MIIDIKISHHDEYDDQGLTGSRYPTRPELFFKYPTRKLKMTGYWVITFHLESNKTQSWMRNPAIKKTIPINPGTRNHFFVIYCQLRKVIKNRRSNFLSVPEAN